MIPRCLICGAAHAVCKGTAGTAVVPVDLPGRIEMATGNGDFVADRDLFLDKEGKVVEADDINKQSKLVSAGASLPAARAAELGLSNEPDEADEDEEASADESVEPKAKAGRKPGRKAK